MGRKTGKHEIDRVAVLLLFAVFAGCMLLVLFLGAAAYKNIVIRDEEAYTARTGVQYIAAKLRHNDAAGMVWTGSFYDGTEEVAEMIPTLYLGMGTEEELYVTRLYYYDGFLRELLCENGEKAEPEDGQEVLPASSFFIEQEGPLLSVTVGDEDGKEHSLSLVIRSATGVAQ